MTIHPFPNAKSKLLGNPEDSIGIIDTPAVAELTGDVSIDSADFSNFDYPVSTGSFTNTPAEAVFITSTVTITKVKNNVRLNIRIVGLGLQNSTVRIRRGGLTGTIVGGPDFVGSSGKIFIINDSNLPIGNTDYVATAQRIGPTARSLETYTPNTLPGLVIVSEPNDTHAGIIATPAIATKQINSPDSHTTHETDVLQ